ncbi:UDP-2,3-diacylglucosamine diphosphatase [Frigidibacter sp. ROC022]|uniref:UDP-2,3-diacylglucosamine diphosphatase n=1 Tax=Frigidibacter sp. ROC022 TaxID=2971796 RepID=UPI00215AE246|nr:UDP-2,3-diacylglucosamine diphosphatase [Frigidibacter sp. ROC022]MCR8725902.1 UDP-2,3-diacylglucosamine diphosphatase [Frigidibacter sp. ROC022]
MAGLDRNLHRPGPQPLPKATPPAVTERPGRGTVTRDRTRHQTLFLSDMHLGARGSRPDLILRFLQENEAETLYLVGDIADNWHPLAQNWTEPHHQVLHHILDLARNGTRVIYIPGNHDAFFRQYAGTDFGGIEVRLEATHRAADGRSYLVVHGDCADVFARRAPLLARLGSLIETGAHHLDGLMRSISRRMRKSEWTGIARMIDATNATIRHWDRFEERLSDLASARGHDGIVCGHFHQPALHSAHGVIYANCGDWVGSNTALAEGFDGQIRLLELSPETETTAPESRRPQTEGGLTPVA